MERKASNIHAIYIHKKKLEENEKWFHIEDNSCIQTHVDATWQTKIGKGQWPLLKTKERIFIHPKIFIQTNDDFCPDLANK